MTNYRRNSLAGGSYFFTVNLANRRLSLLTGQIDLLRAAFRSVRERHPFIVDAAVILPDHLHAIWTLPDGDADFALRWRLIKSAFSHALQGGEPISNSRIGKGEREFGSAGIGSTRSAIKTISTGTLITSTSIR